MAKKYKEDLDGIEKRNVLSGNNLLVQIGTKITDKTMKEFEIDCNLNEIGICYGKYDNWYLFECLLYDYFPNKTRTITPLDWGVISKNLNDIIEFLTWLNQPYDIVVRLGYKKHYYTVGFNETVENYNVCPQDSYIYAIETDKNKYWIWMTDFEKWIDKIIQLFDFEECYDCY